VGDGKGSSTKRRVKTFRPRTAAERTEQELKRMQASSPDAFVNPMSAHMMRSRAKPKAFGGPITKYPLFSREELLQEAAIDAAHDNHPYVQDVTGGLGKPLRKPGESLLPFLCVRIVWCPKPYIRRLFSFAPRFSALFAVQERKRESHTSNKSRADLFPGSIILEQLPPRMMMMCITSERQVHPVP
jgi:hypothetical protein